MKKYTFANGLTVIVEPRKTKSVVIQITVKVGSVYEQDEIAGISHFIEHMLFEGTKKRPGTTQITSQIENLGGDINAATTYERTLYYCKVLKKHLPTAVELLSDMLFNSQFDQKLVEKERKVIVSEIHALHDDPRMYRWWLFTRTLFQKHQIKREISGTPKTVQALSRDQLFNFYKTYYQPKNMVLTLVGAGSDALPLLTKYFKKGNPNPIPHRERIIEPKSEKPQIYTETRNSKQSYFVLGYKTAKRTDSDSYVLDVIKAILARGQSGILFEELRTKRGLCYEVGAHHVSGTDFGYFAVYTALDKKHREDVIKLILKLLKGLADTTPKQLAEAKTFIEGDALITYDDHQECADLLASWEILDRAEAMQEYTKRIQSVTLADVRRVASTYLHENYTLVSIEQKK